jgi:hypothetical protein
LLWSKDAAIPKFGSFQPKASIAASKHNQPRNRYPEDEIAANGKETRHIRRHHGGRHNLDEAGHKPRSSIQDERSGHDRPEARLSGSLKAKDQRHPSAAIASSQLYQVDRKGDPKNIEFGSTHRYDVPSHFRSGFGRVLGLGSAFRMDRDSSNGKTTSISHRSEESSSERWLHQATKLDNMPVQQLLPTSFDRHTEKDVSESDYISFKYAGAKRKRPNDAGSSSSSSSSEDDVHTHRSIEGVVLRSKGTTLDHTSRCQQSKVEVSQPDGLFKLNPLRQRNMELSRIVEQDPKNSSSWAALIDHQDKLLGVADTAEPRKVTNAERKSTADIKLSMYEKALSNIDSNDKAYESLVIGMMEEGANVWTSVIILFYWYLH